MMLSDKRPTSRFRRRGGGEISWSTENEGWKQRQSASKKSEAGWNALNCLENSVTGGGKREASSSSKGYTKRPKRGKLKENKTEDQQSPPFQLLIF